jgi:tetratricopeptide (TPR) repeat protein
MFNPSAPKASTQAGPQCPRLLAGAARRATVAVCLALLTPIAMAIDLNPLWNFSKPDESEQRFRAALAAASPDDQLILQTQIARTYGLRKDFKTAQTILQGLQPQINTASPEARIRYGLELGRSYASATHPKESQTAQTQEQARAAWREALAVARQAKLDGLAIDVLHMMAFVDTAPADQLKWGHEALSVALGSTQPAARQWEASLRNNIGMALHGLKRYPEALTEFETALAVREKTGKPGQVRVARWMVAWTLRALNRVDDALALQLRLEQECAAAGEPDEYVFEELATLYRLKSNEPEAARYAALHKALTK